MRDFKGMKRQRGRNRGGGNLSSGKPQAQNANRAFDSNGPENMKVRGHAQHVFEKYQQLARDATSGGDRVLAENFLQHAEHYFRLLRTIQPNRPVSDFIARDNFASGYDIDFEDESGAQALPDEQPPEAQGDGENRDNSGGDQQQNRGDYQGQQRDNQGGQYRDNQGGQQRDGQQRDRWENRQGQGRNNNRFDRPRDGQPREDRPYRAEGQDGGENRSENNRDRPREDRPYRDDRGYQGDRQARDDRPREDRSSEDRPREERPREERPREDRTPRQDRGERRERTYEPRAERSDPLPVVEPRAEPLTSSRAPAEESTSMLRSRDGEMSHAPAFLQQATPAPAASASGEEAPAKRPRGRPRKVAAPVDEG